MFRSSSLNPKPVAKATRKEEHDEILHREWRSVSVPDRCPRRAGQVSPRP